MRIRIKGFEELYEVDNDGTVYSFGGIVTIMPNGGRRISKPKTLKPHFKLDGYCRVILYKDGKPNGKLVHRLVADAFVLNPENKQEVNHIDGNKQNNAASNLEWCTRKENNNHSVSIGLLKNKGIDYKCCTLTEKDVLQIRFYNSIGGWTQPMLAKRFNTTRGNICNIVRNKTWKHI